MSGGPFTEAGKWESREAAMKGVIPWLVNDYRSKAEALKQKAQRTLRAIQAFDELLKKQG